MHEDLKDSFFDGFLRSCYPTWKRFKDHPLIPPLLMIIVPTIAFSFFLSSMDPSEEEIEAKRNQAKVLQENRSLQRYEVYVHLTGNPRNLSREQFDYLFSDEDFEILKKRLLIEGEGYVGTK